METPAKKKGRTMSPDMLAKLAVARVAALKAKERLVLENYPLKVEKMQKKLEDLKMSDPDPVRLKANKKLQETETSEEIALVATELKEPVDLKVEPKAPMKPILQESGDEDEAAPPVREKRKKKKKGKTVIIQQSSSSESSSSEDEDNHVIYIKKKKKKNSKSKFERLVIPKVRPPPPPPSAPPPAPPPVLAPVPPLFRAPISRFGRHF